MQTNSSTRPISYDGETLTQRGRGRPKAAATKVQVSLRLDPEVLSALRASGPGWRTRVNEMLLGLLFGDVAKGS